MDQCSSTSTIQVTGNLDIDASCALRERLLGAFATEASVTANLSEVEVVSTSALQVLLAAAKDAEMLGKVFRLSEIPQSVLETAQSLGVDLTPYDSHSGSECYAA